MLEKLKKLINNNQEENIKLAVSIIETKADLHNAIAIVCMLKMSDDDVYDAVANIKVCTILMNILKDHDKNYSIRNIDGMLKSYGPKLLYQLSLTDMKSIDNIKYADKYYKDYVTRLTADALRLIKEDNIINKSFEV